MSISDSLIGGVVSGLVTAGLLWVFREFWLRSFQPKIENMLYSDARIDGQWKGTLRANGDIEEIIIVQVGHNISGIARCIKGPDMGSSYKLAGTFRNMILTVSYSAEIKSALDRGTFTMKLTDNGTKFIGHCLYYTGGNGPVEQSEYEWDRAK